MLLVTKLYHYSYIQFGTVTGTELNTLRAILLIFFVSDADCYSPNSRHCKYDSSWPTMNAEKPLYNSSRSLNIKWKRKHVI
jgi:hypothetical protein